MHISQLEQFEQLEQTWSDNQKRDFLVLLARSYWKNLSLPYVYQQCKRIVGSMAEKSKTKLLLEPMHTAATLCFYRLRRTDPWIEIDLDKMRFHWHYKQRDHCLFVDNRADTLNISEEDEYCRFCQLVADYASGKSWNYLTIPWLPPKMLMTLSSYAREWEDVSLLQLIEKV